MNSRLQGRWVLITGASSGFGAAAARAFGAEGAHLLLGARRLDRLEAVAEAARQAGAASAAVHVLDVASTPSVETFTAWVRTVTGRVDVLVNNAGIAVAQDIEQTTTETWRRTLAIHLDGTFFGCHYAIPAMKESGGGSIINMSSTAALIGIPPFLAYSAAKGGIRAMTKSIAVHCRAKGYGIRCNSIHPGSIDTPMVHAALANTRGISISDAKDPEALRKSLGLGEPNDVANMVVFLASDESKHINGAELVIDNGDTIA